MTPITISIFLLSYACLASSFRSACVSSVFSRHQAKCSFPRSSVQSRNALLSSVPKTNSGDLQVSETCVILPVIHMCHSTCYHACLVLSSSRPSPLIETVAATTFLLIIIFPSLVLPLGNVRLISACPGGSANVLVGANERCCAYLRAFIMG